MDRKLIAFAAVLVVGAAALVAVGGALSLGDADPGTETDTPVDDPGGSDGELRTFDNSEAFAAYVAAGRTSAGAGGMGGAPEPAVSREAGGDGAVATDSASGGVPGSDSSVRVGTTNVQERGIDEPDIVKTDGRNFYVSSPRPRYAVEPMPRRADGAEPAPDEKRRGLTHVVDASEPADPQRIAGINASGRMFVVNDTLVVLEGDRLVGYDVSAADDPEQRWTRSLEGGVVSARAMDGQVYLVVSSGLGSSPRCPVEPLGGLTVDCGDIHRPATQVPVDATYTALSLDPASGDVDDSVGFVGTYDTTVYASENALYVTYTDPMDRAELMVDALLVSPVVPGDVKDRIREVRGYNLSARAEQAEVSHTVEEWLASLSESERESTREALSADLEAYASEHAREYVTTGVVRVALDGTSLSVAAQGTVPGRPLNQFSIDEHDGTLRIATTVSGAGAESVNDLYTLNATRLDRVGAVQDMAPGQRIYAVRYVGDRGYLVTFRQIDPFHVVDLSDPSDPVERGIRELPGFSRYLHPISEDLILGVGQEDGRVKTVLFDVSDPENPTIADSKIYDRHWSGVAQSHHAFTIDRRHGVFFLPADGDGLVVSYENRSLSVETTVETDGATRARYVGDYLYVFGHSEIVVVDETTWERETTLELAGESSDRDR